jgi:hypothetical protein
VLFCWGGESNCEKLNGGLTGDNFAYPYTPPYKNAEKRAG